MHCEVRFLDSVENSDFIEIEVKKKDAESHLIKRVALVPFIKTKNGAKYLCKSQYETLKYYEFPTSNLAYSDIPTIKNALNESIIDVTAFYTSFKDYVFAIANSAILRILGD